MLGWLVALPVSLSLPAAECVKFGGYRYAEGSRRQPLTHTALGLRAALLQKQNALQVEEAVTSVDLEPGELSDLLDELVKQRRNLAFRLAKGYAKAGTVARSGTFSALVKRCKKVGEYDECLELVETLHRVGLRGNPNMYLSLIESFAVAGKFDQLLQVYHGMERAGVIQSNQTHTVVLASLMRGGRKADAAMVARDLRGEARGEEYPWFDMSLRNAILQSFLQAGDMREAHATLTDFRTAGLQLSERTLNVVLHGVLATGGPNSLADALDIFNEYVTSEGSVGIVTYNILIHAFARQGQLVNAESLVAQLTKQGLRPDEFTFNSLLQAAAIGRLPRRALQYYHRMRHDGVQVGTTLRQTAQSATQATE